MNLRKKIEDTEVHLTAAETTVSELKIRLGVLHELEEEQRSERSKKVVDSARQTEEELQATFAQQQARVEKKKAATPLPLSSAKEFSFEDIQSLLNDGPLYGYQIEENLQRDGFTIEKKRLSNMLMHRRKAGILKARKTKNPRKGQKQIFLYRLG